MHHHFDDITDKLGTPKWFDRNGFPRYCDFDPDKTSNIYADVVFLVEIACQDCLHKMDVAISLSTHHLCLDDCFKNKWNDIAKEKNIDYGKLIFSHHWDDFFRKFSVEEFLNLLHYGDPPRHGCLGAGETMNCYDVKIKQCWIKNRDTFEFERHNEFEITLEEI